MITNPIPKRILIVSDNDRLARFIELILGDGEWIIEKLTLNSTPQRLEISEVGLIMVALSSPLNEPAAALDRVFPDYQANQSPLFVISENRMRAHQGRLVEQMDFPFDIDEFQDKIFKILQTAAKRPAAPLMGWRD